MKVLLLTALCALVFANQDQYRPRISIQDESFRNGREYRFIYEGQLTSGLPGSSKQHSASRIQAHVHLIFKGQGNQAQLQLRQVRMARLNQQIPNPQAMIPFEAYEQVQISEELERTLQLPLRFQWNQGLIENIELSGQDQPWSVNIKRGVLNLLQVNLQQQNQIQSSQNQQVQQTQQEQQDGPLNSYRVMEDTLEGRCETLYAVTSDQQGSSGPEFSVTKSINFENCERRPDIKYNFRFQTKCPVCDDPLYDDEEKFMRSSTVANYNISGSRDNFLIESARIESIYTFAPIGQRHSVITTYVNQTLRLYQSGPIKSQIQAIPNPQQSDSDMIYTPDWDVLKENFQMQGEEEYHQQNPYSAIEDKVQFVENIVNQLANAVRQNVVEEQAPIQFARLVKALRMLNRQEIRQVHDRFYKNVEQNLSVEKSKKIKDMLIDALAYAGTKDCVEHLVQKTKNGEIPSVQAALAIKALINVRVISKEMIQQVMNLAQSPAAKQNKFLQQSALLTAGSLVNGLCGPSEDKLAYQFKTRTSSRSPQCPPQFRQQIAQKFQSLLDNESGNWYEQILVLKAISNAGLLETLPVLSRVIRDPQCKTMVRAEAILALRQLKNVVPREVQEILLPIFKSRQMPTRLRIAAVYQIMETQPERVVIDQIARKLQTTHNKQVLTFVATLLNTYANSTHPCEKKLARDVQSSLRAGRGISARSWMHPLRSKYLKFTAPCSGTFQVDFASIISQAKIPEHIASGLHLKTMGFWYKHLATLGLVQSDTDDLVRRFLLSGPIHTEDEQQTPRGSSPLKFMRNMWNKLQISGRRGGDEPQMPRGYLYLKIKDQEFGFFPLGQDIYREFQQYARQSFDLPSLERMLQRTHRFELTKAVMGHEMTYKLPTSLGLPLRVNLQLPSVMHVSGSLRAQVQPLGFRMPQQIELETNIKPSGVAALKVDVQAWCPIVNSGAGVRMFAKAHYPVKGQAKLDLTNPAQPEFEVKIEPAQVAIQALSINSAPYTMTRVWPRQPLTQWPEAQYKTVWGEEQQNKATQYVREFGQNALGINFRVEGMQHSIIPNLGGGLLSAPGYLMAGPNRLQLTIEPGQEMPKAVIFRVSAELNQDYQQQMKSGPQQYRQTFQNGFYDQQQDQQFYGEDEQQQEQQQQQYEEENWEQNTSENMAYKIKAEVFSQGSSIKRKAQLESEISMSQDLRIVKLQTKLWRTPIPGQESQKWQMNINGEIVYPQSPFSFQQLFGKSAYSKVQANWGPQGQQGQQNIELQVQATRSPQQQQNDQRHVSYWESEQEKEDQYEMTRRSPVAKYEHLKRAGELLQYNIDLQYQNVPKSARNMAAVGWNIFKVIAFPYTQSDMVAEDLPTNKIQAVISLDEQSRQHLNVRVRSPLDQTVIRDLPLPFPISTSHNLVSSGQPLGEQPMREWIGMTSKYGLQQQMCSVNERRIKTFDQVQYRVPLQDCWTVLAKDCYSQDEPTFAVLIKNHQQGSENKKLRIVSRFNSVVLEPQSEEYDSLKVRVNGQAPVDPEEVQDMTNHGHVVLRVRKEGEQYVRVELPESGVKVYFDGYTANVKVSPMYNGQACGLCGNQDYDNDNDFTGPDNQVTDDIGQFAQQYTLQQGDQCQQQPDCEGNNCSPYKYGEYQYSQQEGQEQYQEDQQYQQGQGNWNPRPQRSTKVVERDGQLCFSKQPVPRCPRNSYPTQQGQPTKVVFACLPSSSWKADRLYQRAERQNEVIEEVRQMEESFYKKMQFPTQCSQYDY